MSFGPDDKHMLVRCSGYRSGQVPGGLRQSLVIELWPKEANRQDREQ